MRARIASLLVLLGLAAGFPQTVHAQETGTLVVTDFVDGDRDGVFVPDQDSGEETRACTISVYSFSQEADPPINRESGPVAQSELDASGTATFVLPAASYAVTRSCQPYSQTWRNSKPACCPNLNMEPDARDLDPRNDWEFSAQVVSVRSGETTTAELRYYPDKDTDTAADSHRYRNHARGPGVAGLRAEIAAHTRTSVRSEEPQAVRT